MKGYTTLKFSKHVICAWCGVRISRKKGSYACALLVDVFGETDNDIVQVDQHMCIPCATALRRLMIDKTWRDYLDGCVALSNAHGRPQPEPEPNGYPQDGTP